MLRVRNIFLFVIATFVSVVAGFSSSLIEAKPVNSDAWMQHHEAFVSWAKTGRVKIAFFGDSLTEQWAAPNGIQAWKAMYPGLSKGNFGISGDKTQNLLWRIRNGEADGYVPSAIVLLIGTNNIQPLPNSSPPVPRYPSAEIAAAISFIVQELRSRFPYAKIILMGLFPRGERSSFERTQVTEVNQIIGKLADNRSVWFLDIGDKFLGPDGNTRKDVMPDRLHLNQAGYAIYGEALRAQLTQLLGSPGA